MLHPDRVHMLPPPFSELSVSVSIRSGNDGRRSDASKPTSIIKCRKPCRFCDFEFHSKKQRPIEVVAIEGCRVVRSLAVANLTGLSVWTRCTECRRTARPVISLLSLAGIPRNVISHGIAMALYSVFHMEKSSVHQAGGA
jgi:hypothetical protein